MGVSVANHHDDIVVAALYRFVRLENFEVMRAPLLEVCSQHNLRGTLLLAKEGINGTVSGARSDVERVLEHLRSDARLADIDCKFSNHAERPFLRMKVKLKKEIVTMGQPDIDPNACVGRYASASKWNELIDDPDCLVIDTRNEYEVEIGTFKGAVNPHTNSFREFPDWVESHLDPENNRKVAMFCTGGIRCEKATALLVEKGFEEVWHLKGGILKYFEDMPEPESRWQGECFVFDSRVSVNHHLEKGRFEQCFACRFPIDEEQMASEHYLPGVSCPRCFDRHTDDQRERFSERQRQINLSKERGESHLGADAAAGLKS